MPDLNLDPPEGYMTTDEAAKRLGIVRGTVLNQIRNGRMQGIRRRGRVFVLASSVEHYRLNRLPEGVALKLGRKRRG